MLSGCRISEITGLTSTQILKHSSGVRFLRITDAKTSAGERDVPLPSSIFLAGFEDFIKGKKQIFKYKLRLGKGSGNADSVVGAVGELPPNLSYTDLAELISEIETVVSDEEYNIRKIRDQVIARVISAIANYAAMPPDQTSLKNSLAFRSSRGGLKIDQERPPDAAKNVSVDGDSSSLSKGI